VQRVWLQVALAALADLLANAPTDPEAHLDPARVERYAQVLDALPPVVVFDTPERPLLADGYHRLAAARRRGLVTAKQQAIRRSATSRRRSMFQGVSFAARRVYRGVC
jgi:hypothetical protein